MRGGPAVTGATPGGPGGMGWGHAAHLAPSPSAPGTAPQVPPPAQGPQEPWSPAAEPVSQLTFLSLFCHFSLIRTKEFSVHGKVVVDATVAESNTHTVLEAPTGQGGHMVPVSVACAPWGFSRSLTTGEGAAAPQGPGHTHALGGLPPVPCGAVL